MNYNWYNLVVTDAGGKPAPVTLKPGKHVARMTNISGRVGLDSFGFLRTDIDAEVLGQPGLPVVRPVPSPTPAPVPAATPGK